VVTCCDSYHSYRPGKLAILPARGQGSVALLSSGPDLHAMQSAEHGNREQGHRRDPPAGNTTA